MSRFFSNKYKNLIPYTPGEQPKERSYIKLNTNESPFPPSPKAVKMAKKAAGVLQLYPDPDCKLLTKTMAETLGVSEDQLIFTNGSDDVLNFAFMAFCDQDHPAIFPDITYGFYSVFAEANQIPYETVPLCDDFSINPEDYFSCGKTIFIANPNAPTGLALSLDQIENILKTNPDSVVVIDEAYVDFGAESAISLVPSYPNLLVTQTFSKSRSMAGARLGFGVAQKELISDLNTLRYSTNPYNINAMTMASGIGSLKDQAYFQKNCKAICKNREFASRELLKLGFETTNSKANFVFARHPKISGGDLYSELKRRGILVRYFSAPRISDYCRITVGSELEMKKLIKEIALILEDLK